MGAAYTNDAIRLAEATSLDPALAVDDPFGDKPVLLAKGSPVTAVHLGESLTRICKQVTLRVDPAPMQPFMFHDRCIREPLEQLDSASGKLDHRPLHDEAVTRWLRRKRSIVDADPIATECPAAQLQPDGHKSNLGRVDIQDKQETALGQLTAVRPKAVLKAFPEGAKESELISRRLLALKLEEN